MSYKIYKMFGIGFSPEFRSHGGEFFLPSTVGAHGVGAVFRSAPDFGMGIDPPSVETTIEIDIEDEFRIWVDGQVMGE